MKTHTVLCTIATALCLFAAGALADVAHGRRGEALLGEALAGGQEDLTLARADVFGSDFWHGRYPVAD